MNERIIASNRICGLSLTQDDQDPPRFYVRSRNRRDLVSIGDLSQALSAFSLQVRRFRSGGSIAFAYPRSRRPLFPSSPNNHSSTDGCAEWVRWPVEAAGTRSGKCTRQEQNQLP